MSKVLIYAPYAIWTPHHETELELAENHLINGDKVVWIECFRDLSFCEPNPEHKLINCIGCLSKSRSGVSLLSKKVEILRLPSLTPEEECNLEPMLNIATSSREALKDFKINNFDIGMAVLSSLISYTRDPIPDFSNGKNQYSIKSIFKSSYVAYYGIRKLLHDSKYDRLYVLNGRFGPARGAWRAAEFEKVECVMHERGSTDDKYALHYNAMPHQVAPTKLNIEKKWGNADKKGRLEIARNFYEQNMAGQAVGFKSYTKDQKRNKLPESWDASNNNVVFFTSSENEFFSIDEARSWQVFQSQVEAIEFIAKKCAHEKRRIWIRMHPNQIDMSPSMVKPYNSLEALDNVTVIRPESLVSSYDLMLAADVVVTVGSTIGIEAAYWGRPSILLGEAEYRGFDSTYDALTPADISGWLSNFELLPKPILGAEKYGYYRMTFGNEYRHFKSNGFSSGTFKGVRIKPHWLLMLGFGILNQYKKMIRLLYA